MITPGHSTIVDLGLKLLTGESAQKNYGQKRESLMDAVEEQFQVKDKRLFPPMGGRVVCLYTGLRLRPRAVALSKTSLSQFLRTFAAAADGASNRVTSR